MHIIEKLQTQFKSQDVSLVAVSKTRPDEQVLTLYDKGQRIFGENRVQELVAKHERFPKDAIWHMIGHLQTNKVKQIAPFISLIHSGDSFKLLQEIDKQAKNNDRIIKVLLQIHIAEEVAKYGLFEQDLPPIFEAVQNDKLPNIKVCGLMGMATFTSDKSKVATEFASLKTLFNKLQNMDIFDSDFSILSMGMSGDYEIAIAQGANMVRIGSLLF